VDTRTHADPRRTVNTRRTSAPGRPAVRLAALGAGLAATALALTACSGGAAAGGDDSASGPIVIASWGGDFSQAMRDTIAAPFTEETGIEVEVVDATDHLTQIRSMEQAGNVEWDILDSMSLSSSAEFAELGLLQEWPEDVRDMLLDEYGEDNVTDTSYAWSGYGHVIFCNEDAVEACPTTIEELFDTAAFPGRRAMPPSSDYTLPAILAAAGGTPRDEVFADDETPEHLRQTLETISDSVSMWWANGDMAVQAIRQGEVDMGIALSGDIYKLIDEGMNLSISWDGVYIVGATSVLADAPHSEAAMQFVEWVSQNPEAQAAWSEAVRFTVPHPEAVDFLPAELAEQMPTYPENYDQLMKQDVQWYVDNRDAIDRELQTVIAG
jgi:putative spermidine/putrescine transport system substrate-binding protein